MSATESVELAEVADVNPRLSERLDPAHLFSFVPMSDLNARSGRAVSSEVRRFAEIAKGYTTFRDGDVLVAKITPCFENGKTGIAELQHEFGAGSTEFHVVRPRPGLLDVRYLSAFLRQQSVIRMGEGRMTGSGGQRRVPAAFLSRLRIPLPSFDEQRRIADVLDCADALRAKRRETLKRLDELTQSIFVDMFGASVAGSGVVSDLVERCEAGRNLSDASSPHPSRRVLKVSAVTSLDFLPSEAKEVDAAYDPPNAHFVRQGDVLFSRANTTQLIGATAVVRGPIDDVLLPDKLWRLVPRAGRTEPEFLAAALQQPAVRLEVGRRATGSSASMQNISQSKLLSVPLPAPSLAHQRRFVDAERSVRSARDASRTHLALLDELFASLQQRAFRGDLFSSPLPPELADAVA